MRDYLQKLSKKNQIRVIERSVDPEFELAALVKLSQQRDESVVMFNHVRGTRMPVVSNIYGNRSRLCDLIGAEEGNFCRRWDHLLQQLPYFRIEDNIEKVAGNARISGHVSDLPRITSFAKDAGPYITSAIFLALHPDTGVSNLSFHRSMYVDDKELRVRLGSTHDLFHYYRIAQAKNEALPAALLIGVPPEFFISACASLPCDQDEISMASIIRRAPVKMTSCETLDLMVPAETEIVIEGRFLPHTLKPEGPFGEFMGYYVPEADNHVFRISRVSWRRDPIFHTVLCGTAEDLYPLDYAVAARLYHSLTRQLPGIVNVACYPYLLNTVVQIHQEYDGHARKVLLAAVAAHMDYSKTCIVVDEDVNIHDMNDVWWAYITRGRADTRAQILADIPGFYRDEKKDHWGRLLIDATKPFDRQDEFERKQIPGIDRINLDDYL